MRTLDVKQAVLVWNNAKLMRMFFCLFLCVEHMFGVCMEISLVSHDTASTSGSSSSLLRRSSRSKVQQSAVTTGSCVSSTASTSQACTYQIRGAASLHEAGTSSTIASHST